jgi:probable HAF family extracellular repeat protein
MQDLGSLPGGTASRALSLNHVGQVVGSSSTASGATHAFLYHEGEMCDLGTLGGTFSVANGINERGEVVGRAETARGEQHAFLHRDGKMRNLGTLGGSFSEAHSINNRGQAVGQSTTASGSGRAFLVSGGGMEDLNALLPARSGWVLETARDINDAGQVVGWGIHRGRKRAFLLRPRSNGQWQARAGD